ncbi:CG16782 [Drosophila busckii]|uniref:CG16782 n=1 Tax=Drosophila busckii TaxID=30019 RepID=A0A0M4F8L9_DROBS|nr:uncharacterized protein LOC108607080 [Drosophila busckii]ALC48750.1 CG16782 [Drosophila busckii]
MSDNVAINSVLNLLLCGATGYGCYTVGVAHPYAFSACVIGLCHGLVGLIDCLTSDENAKKCKDMTTALMEIVPLPLVNVELFFGGESNNIGLGHGLFIVPLAISCLVALCKNSGEEVSEAYDTIKLMTILGNITSLCYLAVNESSWLLGGMAFLAFMAKYGAEFCESEVSEGSGQPITYISWSAFFFLATMAVGGEK